jgi:hypothetical protein
MLWRPGADARGESTAGAGTAVEGLAFALQAVTATSDPRSDRAKRVKDCISSPQLQYEETWLADLSCEPEKSFMVWEASLGSRFHCVFLLRGWVLNRLRR